MKDFSLLPIEMRKWALKHLRVEKVGNGIFVRLTPNGYVLNLGRDFYDLYSEGQKKVILLHEISHVLRGDCLARYTEEIDRSFMNEILNLIVNQGLESEFEKNFPRCPVVGRPPIYKDVKAEMENLPEYVPDKITLYNLLKNNRYRLVMGLDAPPELDAENEEEKERAKIAHIKAFMDAREVEDQTMKALAGKDLSIGMAPVSVQMQPLPIWAKAIENVQSKMRSCKSSLSRVRTYNRPGRVEGLRGISRQPKLSVFVILDVSGSCEHLKPTFLGIAATLKRRFDVRLGIFADRFAELQSAYKLKDVGGGTQISPVISAIEKAKPDLAIIITDGHFFDNLNIRKVTPRLWFVIFGEKPGWADLLRKGDRLIVG